MLYSIQSINGSVVESIVASKKMHASMGPEFDSPLMQFSFSFLVLFMEKQDFER